MSAPELWIPPFFAALLFLLYAFGRLLLYPLRPLLKLLFNSLLGAASIILLNVFGKGFFLYIPLTPVNAVVAGVLGLPGVLLLLAIRMIYL